MTKKLKINVDKGKKILDISHQYVIFSKWLFIFSLKKCADGLINNLKMGYILVN